MNQTWVWESLRQVSVGAQAGTWTPQVLGSVPELKSPVLVATVEAQTAQRRASTHLTVLRWSGSPPKWRGRKRGTSSSEHRERKPACLVTSRNSHVQLTYPQFCFVSLFVWLSLRARHQIKQGEEEACAHSEAAPWTALTQRSLVFVYQFPDSCLGQFPPRLLSTIYSSHCHTAGGWGSVCVGGGGWRWVRVCFELEWTDGRGVNTPPECDWHRLHPITADIPKIFSGLFFGTPPISLITCSDWLFGGTAAGNTPVTACVCVRTRSNKITLSAVTVNAFIEL